MMRILVVALAAISFVFLGGACSELEARRDIQKGDKLYEEGKYAEAIAVYEGALKEADLDIGHHNLAVAAFIAFQPDNSSPANLRYAEKASKHFQLYLKSHPEDNEIIGLLTTIWLDSDKIDQALAYWVDVRAKNPRSIEALRQLGSIQRLAGDFKEAVKWDYLRVEQTEEVQQKVQILVGIGNLQYSRLSKKKNGSLIVMDRERLELADIGIEALQKALALQPKNASAHSLLATIYQYRSFAHLNGWGKLADIASQRFHGAERDRLSKAKRAANSAVKASPKNDSKDDKTSAEGSKPEAKE